MEASFLSDVPMPGNGAWLMKGGQWPNQRGSTAKSFLPPTAHEHTNKRQARLPPASRPRFLGNSAENITSPTPHHHQATTHHPENGQPRSVSFHGPVVAQQSPTSANIHQHQHVTEDTHPTYTHQASGEDSGDVTHQAAMPDPSSIVLPPHLRKVQHLRQSAPFRKSNDRDASHTPHSVAKKPPTPTAVAAPDSMPPKAGSKASPLVQTLQDANAAENNNDASAQTTKKRGGSKSAYRRARNKAKVGFDGTAAVRHDSPASNFAKSEKMVDPAPAPYTSRPNVPIAQKLAEEHGVKVSNPQRATFEQAKPKLDSVEVWPEPLPPWVVESDSGRQNGASGGRGGGRGRARGRGRGDSRGRGGRGGGDSRWVRTSDIRPDRNRWDIEWDDRKKGEKANQWDQTGWSDNGWGDQWGKSNIQKNDGHPLMDWSGGWAPAPIDWDSRPAFHDDQGAEKIDKWLDKIEEDMRDIERSSHNDDLGAIDSEPTPRYWVPKTINNVVTNTFWNEYTKSQMPLPMDDGDLEDAQPWWSLYRSNDSTLLHPYRQPIMRGIDPHNENEDERLARENDYGSSQHAENRKRKEMAIRNAEHERRRKIEKRLAKLSTAELQQRQRTAIRPGFKVVVRAAKGLEDVIRIRQIYNFYAYNSVIVPETSNITEDQIDDLMHLVKSENLPFLVACEKAQKVRGSKRYHNGDDVLLPEKVVGFAYATDYYKEKDTCMYQRTAEVKVFVDGLYTKRSVARCLMDKLLALLDPNYIEKGGYDVTRIAGDMDGTIPFRKISNMIINLPYETDDDRRIKWTARWLEEGLGFEQVGHLKRIAEKRDKMVNVAILLRRIEEPASTPTKTAR